MRKDRIKQVLEKRQPDLHVVLEKLKNPQNISAIVRTCDAVGVQYLHVVEETRCIALSHKVSRGSLQWIDITFYQDIKECLKKLKEKDIKIYATVILADSKDFRDVDYTKACAIVVGSELEGVSEVCAAYADERIYIPMVGFVQSLNVSVATAIILYEAFRQRERAGMYKTSRLSHEEYERIYEKWIKT